jgi:hypothetical protein
VIAPEEFMNDRGKFATLSDMHIGTDYAEIERRLAVTMAATMPVPLSIDIETNWPTGDALIRQAASRIHRSGSEPATVRYLDVEHNDMQNVLQYMIAAGVGINTATIPAPPIEYAALSLEEVPALRREMVSVKSVMDDLAIQAESILGYDVLRKDKKLEGVLSHALHALEIEPFNNESVHAYKSSMLNNALVEARQDEKYKGRYVGQSTYSAKTLNPTNKSNFREGNLSDEDRKYLKPYQKYVIVHWLMSHLNGYARPVPEFALFKALSIKKLVPNVKFYVEELKLEEHIYDPFLVACTDSEFFYIEVWDEPKFEAAQKW